MNSTNLCHGLKTWKIYECIAYPYGHLFGAVERVEKLCEHAYDAYLFFIIYTFTSGSHVVYLHGCFQQAFFNSNIEWRWIFSRVHCTRTRICVWFLADLCNHTDNWQFRLKAPTVHISFHKSNIFGFNTKHFSSSWAQQCFSCQEFHRDYTNTWRKQKQIKYNQEIESKAIEDVRSSTWVRKVCQCLFKSGHYSSIPFDNSFD